MAFAQRMAASMEKVLWRTIKESVKLIKGLTKDCDFIDTYKYCYPNLWLDVCRYHQSMKQWNKNREKKGLKAVYSFKSPKAYLYSKYQQVAAIKTLDGINHGDIQGQIESLRKESLKKLDNRLRKAQQRERYEQHVKPTYVQQYIQAYYVTRKQHPENIDTRYLIVHELVKYKCEEVIEFLKSLVRCEKNLSLQHYAWECLNIMGITGVHKGRRKGKKKKTHTKDYTPISTPHDLLEAIYNSPLEKMKHYDLFLSHSYKDKDRLIKLKDSLNGMGLNVYMDWVNDKAELHRTLTSAETAAVIAERMKASKAILYVHTPSSMESKWMPWELGCAYAFCKPVLVYRPEAVDNEPEYLQLYQSVTIENGRFVIEGQKCMSLVEWIREHD